MKTSANRIYAVCVLGVYTLSQKSIPDIFDCYLKPTRKALGERRPLPSMLRKFQSDPEYRIPSGSPPKLNHL